jgi:chlorobactene glucosyltransferase
MFLDREASVAGRRGTRGNRAELRREVRVCLGPLGVYCGLLDGATVELVLSCIWLAVVIWLIARAFIQRGLLRTLEPATPPPPHSAPEVAIIVPARDEAANIGRCLQSLVAQSYPNTHLRIVVVDDHSIDATPAIAAAFAAKHRQVTVLHSPPLPPHWIGKAHACWIGAQAIGADAQWLCFIDADVSAEPGLVAGAIGAVTSEQLDLLSLAPRQELQSFAERLVMPCGLYLLAFYQDLRVVQARNSPETTATGQFILVRRSLYDAVGGHAAVHGAICEDLMLARLLKRSNGCVLLQDGRRLLSTRMYTGWSTLWIGVSKNLSDMLGGPVRTIAIAFSAVALAWAALLIPLADAASCARENEAGCVALIPAALGSAAAFGLHIAGASYFRIPPWYGLLFPLGYSAGAAMAIDSVRRRLSGHVSWKGRTYP